MKPKNVSEEDNVQHLGRIGWDAGGNWYNVPLRSYGNTFHELY